MLVELPCCLECCYPLPWKGDAGERWGAMKWDMQVVSFWSFLIFNAVQSFWCNFFSELWDGGFEMHEGKYLIWRHQQKALPVYTEADLVHQSSLLIYRLLSCKWKRNVSLRDIHSQISHCAKWTILPVYLFPPLQALTLFYLFKEFFLILEPIFFNALFVSLPCRISQHQS